MTTSPSSENARLRAEAAAKLYQLQVQRKDLQREIGKATFELNSLFSSLLAAGENIPVAIRIEGTSNLLVVMAVNPLKTEIIPLEGAQP